MAGSGRKVWTEETLATDDLQNYLQDQVVMVFATAAARAGTIPAPTEGMTTYLKSTGQMQYYTGTAWRDVAIARVSAADVVPGRIVGDYRDHPTYGLQRWDGAAWGDPNVVEFVDIGYTQTFYSHLTASPMRLWRRGRRRGLQGVMTAATISGSATTAYPFIRIPAADRPIGDQAFIVPMFSPGSASGTSIAALSIRSTDNDSTYYPSVALSNGMTVSVNGVEWWAGA